MPSHRYRNVEVNLASKRAVPGWLHSFCAFYPRLRREAMAAGWATVLGYFEAT